MKRIAHYILTLAVCATLAACGAGQEGPLMVGDPSQSVAVPCEQSAECRALQASGEHVPVCSEAFIGYPPVMSSTWDNGKTWERGNCDQTNEAHQAPKK